jgi:methyl-accepting chemotaxis protein
MALVKTSALTPKQSAPSGKPDEAVRTEGRVKLEPAQRRAQVRSRARHEQAAERIGAATEELSAGITEAAAAAEELRRSLEQIASAAEEAAGAAQESQAAVSNLGAIFAQGRERAGTSSKKAEALHALLSESAAQIEALVSAVQDNSERQLRSVDVVEMLDSQAANIGEITRTVADVSDQTNLLALNAAIEAARAGDHGRGFSVVADEVRAFAETTEKSAREVQELAEAISSHVRLVVTRIKTAAEKARMESQSGRDVIGALDIIRKDMMVFVEGSRSILLTTETAEAAAVEAQRGAQIVASAAEQQASATAEAQRAVDQQTKALDQSQTTAQELARLADNLHNDTGVAMSSEQLAAAAEELSASIQELSGAATQILAAIEQISLGAQAQAAASHQSGAALAQIEKAATALQNAAGEAAERASALAPIIRANRETVVALSDGIAVALEETVEIGRVLSALQESGRRIEKIVDAIALVAVQTNMLAVSGSVEAARAREFGRGFAVVSSDIRSLSRQSSDSANRAKDVALAIQNQIGIVRRDLDQISISSQAAIRKNHSVLDRLASVETLLGHIGEGSSDLLSASQAIVNSVRQVSAGTQQIAAASEEAGSSAVQAASAARQQAKGAEDLAAAIEEIASLADELDNAKS